MRAGFVPVVTASVVLAVYGAPQVGRMVIGFYPVLTGGADMVVALLGRRADRGGVAEGGARSRSRHR